MSHALRWVAELCMAGAVIGCAYTIAAGIMLLARGAVRDAMPPPLSFPPVTVLKPLCGAEPGLLERLAAFCAQDYAGPVQVVFGVQVASDPAIEVVRELQARFPRFPIALQVDGREHGGNRKVSNLINMLPLARHDTLIISDCDMIVGPHYLSEVAATLAQPGVGAASCLYYGVAADSISSRLAALAINTHFLPLVVTALRLRLAQPCFGATIAIRGGLLDEIGGLGAFGDVLPDDHAIGYSVRSTGREVAFAPTAIGHACPDCGLGTTWSRQLRVARTIRLIDPIGYAGTIIANPFALALVAALMGSPGAAAVMSCALVCRIILCAGAQRAFRMPPQPYWLIPVHDVIAFAIYAVSFAGTTVMWRGYRYSVAEDGTMTKDAARSA
jgi:ceramide glucosyltransferase